MYLAMVLFQIYRCTSADAMKSTDLVNYYQIFLAISAQGELYTTIVATEPILPFLYYIFSTFVTLDSLIAFNLFHLSLFFGILYFPLRKITYNTTALFFVMLLLDSVLLTHLFRQFFASIFILMALVAYKGSGWKSGVFLLSAVIAILTHNTSLIFLPLCLFFSNIDLRTVKFILAGAFIVSFLGLLINNRDLLSMLYGIPILGKAYYALIYTSDTEAGLRLVTDVGAVLAFFVKTDEPYIKVVIGFIALSIAFSSIHILNIRIGLIGSGLLTGLVFFHFVEPIRILTFSKFIRKTKLV